MSPNDDAIELATTTLDASYWRQRAQRLEDGIRQHRDDWPSRIGDPTPHDERLWALLDAPHDD